MKISDKERLKKIIKTWDSLQKQMEEHHITRDVLLNDEFSQWAVTTPLYNIGEQVYMLSTDFKKANSDIPWSVVSGLRHRLVHDYEGINWSIIVEVVFDEMDDFQTHHIGTPAVLLRYKNPLCNITLLIITILMPFKFGVEVDFDVEFFVFLGDNNAVHRQP